MPLPNSKTFLPALRPDPCEAAMVPCSCAAEWFPFLFQMSCGPDNSRVGFFPSFTFPSGFLQST